MKKGLWCGCLVYVITVCALYLIVGASEVFTCGDMRLVVGREVGACACNTLRGLGTADVSSMAPLETSGALPAVGETVQCWHPLMMPIKETDVSRPQKPFVCP